MRTLKVNIPNREYNINIERGAFDHVARFVREIYSGAKVFIITDDNVNELYSEKVSIGLISDGLQVCVVSCLPGEGTKSIGELSRVYSKLLAKGITRSDLIIALGGGVIGDLTGLVAATLLRGIPFVQMPTTLLAQVDSSVGGKTAVNLPEGKNLVGTFSQPKSVIIDPDCLHTLDIDVYASGMAEIIKYGAIADKQMFMDLLDTNVELDVVDVIFNCCDIKRRVVESDELDTGNRMILNFGHTFGHAIEKLGNYTEYSHGFAVGLGMVMSAKLGENLGITQKGTADLITRLLRANRLPTEVDIRTSDIVKALHSDKKREGDKINLILLKDIGKVIIKRMEMNEIENAI